MLVVADAAFSGSDAQVGRQIKFERALGVVLAAGPRNLDVLRARGGRGAGHRRVYQRSARACGEWTPLSANSRKLITSIAGLFCF